MNDRRDTAKTSAWNSLEVVKLFVAVLTPAALALLGYLITDGLQRQLAETQRLRDFRVEIYKTAGPLLNDIFAYNFFVGKWKELTPQQLFANKKELDTLMYSYESLFSSDFFQKYEQFMGQSFRQANDWKKESFLRTGSNCRQKPDTADKWKEYFTEEDNRNAMCVAYRDLVGSLSDELLFMSVKEKRLAKQQKPNQCPSYDIATCS
jgi:hypothetical protein